MDEGKKPYLPVSPSPLVAKKIYDGHILILIYYNTGLLRKGCEVGRLKKSGTLHLETTAKSPSKSTLQSNFEAPLIWIFWILSAYFWVAQPHTSGPSIGHHGT